MHALSEIIAGKHPHVTRFSESQCRIIGFLNLVDQVLRAIWLTSFVNMFYTKYSNSMEQGVFFQGVFLQSVTYLVCLEVSPDPFCLPLLYQVPPKFNISVLPRTKERFCKVSAELIMRAFSKSYHLPQLPKTEIFNRG